MTGAAPPHRPPPLLPAFAPLQIPCRSRVSPPWSPILRFPSPIPLQIPLQRLPARGLCVASLIGPLPVLPPAPLSPLRHPYFHFSPHSAPEPRRGRGNPPAASREWRGGRGRPVPSESYPLSKSAYPQVPAKVAQRLELWPLRGGRGPGGAALPAPPPHAQHPPLRPLPRTPPRCSAHVGSGRRLKRWEERLVPTLLPRRRALGARSLWRWRTRIGSGGPGTFPGRPALVPMPSSPAACPLTPSLHLPCCELLTIRPRHP